MRRVGRWLCGCAWARRAATALGVLAVLAGLVLLAPGWWARVAAAAGHIVARHWPSVVLIIGGLATLASLVGYRWRTRGAPDRARRPIAGRLPLFEHMAWLLGLAAVLAVGLAWLLWWALGRPPLAAVGATVWTTQNTFDAVKIVLLVVAGIGGVVALTVSYRKQDLGENAEHREATRLFTERYNRAAELIGSSNAAARMAGIYAIAGLANDWAAGRQTCIDVLCAYRRMAPFSGEVAAAHQEGQGRNIALQIIATHLQPDANPSWQGHRFDFTEATGKCDFTGINVAAGTTLVLSLAGPTSFSKARFSGGGVEFPSETFPGTLDFRDTTISAGRINFSGVTFSGGRVNFRGAEFSGGKVLFSSATFSGGEVDFAEARFAAGKVDFHEARFSGGAVHFDRATFAGTVVGTVVDLSRPAEWSGEPTGVTGLEPGVLWPSQEHLAKIANPTTVADAT